MEAHSICVTNFTALFILTLRKQYSLFLYRVPGSDVGLHTRWGPLPSARGANWHRPQEQEEGQRQGQEICLEPRK